MQKKIKLKEFDFKLFHEILPCTVNHRKWGIKISDQCDVCGMPRTIEHLLFICCYVKPLRRVVQSVSDIIISFESILQVDDNSDCDNIITSVSFLIWKQWIILSLENKSRSNVTTLKYFKDELSTCLRIYDMCKKFSAKEIFNIEALIECL